MRKDYLSWKTVANLFIPSGLSELIREDLLKQYFFHIISSIVQQRSLNKNAPTFEPEHHLVKLIN